MQIADLERSNLFESHWSNQWLTQDRVTCYFPRPLVSRGAGISQQSF